MPERRRGPLLPGRRVPGRPAARGRGPVAVARPLGGRGGRPVVARRRRGGLCRGRGRRPGRCRLAPGALRVAHRSPQHRRAGRSRAQRRDPRPRRPAAPPARPPRPAPTAHGDHDQGDHLADPITDHRDCMVTREARLSACTCPPRSPCPTRTSTAADRARRGRPRHEHRRGACSPRCCRSCTTRTPASTAPCSATSPATTRSGARRRRARRWSSSAGPTPTCRRPGTRARPSTAASSPPGTTSTAHVYGRLVVHDDPAWVEALVRRLTAKHEGGAAAPVVRGRRPAAFVAGQLRAIVGMELRITQDRGEGEAEPEPPGGGRRRRRGRTRGTGARGGVGGGGGGTRDPGMRDPADRSRGDQRRAG